VVVTFTTPSGVTGWVDASIPLAVFIGFIRKLRRKLARRLRVLCRRQLGPRPERLGP
jgi:hypothetical protein